MAIFVYESGGTPAGWQQIPYSKAWIGDGSTAGGRTLIGGWIYDSNTTTWRQFFSGAPVISSFGNGLARAGSKCTDGNRRAWDFSWQTTNVDNALYNMEITITTGLNSLVSTYTDTTPDAGGGTRHQYALQCDGYAAAGGTSMFVTYSWRLTDKSSTTIAGQTGSGTLAPGSKVKITECF